MDYRTVIQSLGRLQLVIRAAGAEREQKALFFIVLHILRVLDHELYNEFRGLEVDDEYVIRQVFSRASGEKLIETDVGSAFAVITVVLVRMLGGNAEEVEERSQIYQRLRSTYVSEQNPQTPGLGPSEPDELIDLMSAGKCLNSLHAIESQLQIESTTFTSLFNLIELIQTTTT